MIPERCPGVARHARSTALSVSAVAAAARRSAAVRTPCAGRVSVSWAMVSALSGAPAAVEVGRRLPIRLAHGSGPPSSVMVAASSSVPSVSGLSALASAVVAVAPNDIHHGGVAGARRVNRVDDAQRQRIWIAVRGVTAPRVRWRPGANHRGERAKAGATRRTNSVHCGAFDPRRSDGNGDANRLAETPGALGSPGTCALV